jgi:hypothetical protein
MGMLRTPTGATKAVARAFNNLALEARKYAGMALDSVTDPPLAHNAQAESVRPKRERRCWIAGYQADAVDRPQDWGPVVR